MRAVTVLALALLGALPGWGAPGFHERPALGDVVYEVGTPRALLGQGDVIDLCFSPDGSKVVAIRQPPGTEQRIVTLVEQTGGHRDLFHVDLTKVAARSPVRVVGMAVEVEWSADSSALFARVGMELWWLPLQGKPLQLSAYCQCYGWAGNRVYYHDEHAGNSLLLFEPATGRSRPIGPYPMGEIEWGQATDSLSYRISRYTPAGPDKQVAINLADGSIVTGDASPPQREPLPTPFFPIPSPDIRQELGFSGGRSVRAAFGGTGNVVLADKQTGRQQSLTSGGRCFPLGWLAGGKAALYVRTVPNRDEGGELHPDTMQLWMTPVGGPHHGRHFLLAHSFTLPRTSRGWEHTFPHAWGPGGLGVLYADAGNLMYVPLSRTNLPLDKDGDVVDREQADQLCRQVTQGAVGIALYAVDHDLMLPGSDWASAIEGYLRDPSVLDLPGMPGRLAFKTSPPGWGTTPATAIWWCCRGLAAIGLSMAI